MTTWWVVSGPPVTGVRYLIGDIPVDLFPFGGVEDPAGTVVPASRRSSLSVIAFQEVFDHALTLSLEEGLSIRIPSPAGYAALKMFAWAERSIGFEDRDAPDLAVVAYWYQESTEIADRLYGTDDGQRVLIATDWDKDLATAQLLGRDVVAELGTTRARDLRDAWLRTDLNYLTNRFGSETLPGWPTDRLRRRSIVDRLSRAIMREVNG